MGSGHFQNTPEESDLLRMLHSTEHTFVERKTIGDSRDWVKTIVAFANTLATNQHGILFVGATDAGEIESRLGNLDKLQRTFSEKMQAAYPPIYYITKIIQENNRECLAVIVPGSAMRPHFAGPPYLRDGSQSIVAKSEQYESLLAARVGKVFELQKWISKSITIRSFTRSTTTPDGIRQSTAPAKVVAANQFYLTVFYNNRHWSYPLSRFEIAFDHERDCLEIELLPPPL